MSTIVSTLPPLVGSRTGVPRHRSARAGAPSAYNRRGAAVADGEMNPSRAHAASGNWRSACAPSPWCCSSWRLAPAAGRRWEAAEPDSGSRASRQPLQEIFSRGGSFAVVRATKAAANTTPR
jgi:hypothetical protein